MKTLSAALAAEQTAKSSTPYVKFKLTSADGNTTYDYTTRVLSIEHHEEAYNDYATVILDNHDRGIATGLKGYWVQIAYGYITGNAVADVEGAESAGNNDTAEYSYTPRLWVWYQREFSARGQLKTILLLEGAWSLLKMLQVVDTASDPPSFFQQTFTATTVYDIMDTLLTAAGFSLDALGTQDDGIVDTLTPTFYVNGADALDSFDYYGTLIYQLLTMTKGYLRSKTGLAFKFIYPQSDDPVNRTYYSDQQYIFKEYLESKKLLVPNHIYVMWDYDAVTDTWTFDKTTVGEASDATEIAGFMDVPEIIKAEEITSEAEADDRAAAILVRRKGELLSGHIVVRHDCAIELYDRIQIQDVRGK